MSKCNFSISFSGDADSVLSKARAAIEKQGGIFNGDTNNGHFSINVFGTINGDYTITGNQLNIAIANKPLMIPCSAIENVLKSQIG